MKKIKPIDIKRVDPNLDVGLTNEQVEARKKAKLINKIKKTSGKSYIEIIFRNIINFYNIFLAIVAILLIYGEMYWSLFFVIVYLCNLGIGLFQDIKARKLLSKLQLVTQSKIEVIRDGLKVEIPTDELVLDDIAIIKNSHQIPSDAIILKGTIGVNESMLTGESLTIYKDKDCLVYAGSYVTSGEAIIKIIRVGKENYINKMEHIARDKKATKSRLKRSLDALFRIISFLVLIVTILIVVGQWNDFVYHFQDTVGSFAGSLVAMIPAGLYLLTSVTLTVGVINLARKRAMIQDFYSIEMLARSNVLCLDKTGTITDGTMKVKEVIALNGNSRARIDLIIANLLNATKDSNATATALKEAFDYKPTEVANYVCPFNSENKYSFATFSRSTYILGAIECLDVYDKEAMLEKIKKYLQEGLRVLILAKANSKQTGKSIKGKSEVMAMIILEDHIKDDAAETIKWFQDNDVKVRVISGDNAITVSQIAKKVNIKDAYKFVSLEGKTNEEIKELAKEYVVFGRVTPEQKEILVQSFEDNGDVVAMTGDGVNDILALRIADCSIAMANGSDAAQNVSQLVLLDSNFSSLPAVVAEGRRVVNNIQRTSSLFSIKTLFAIVLSIIFAVSSFFTKASYPFLPNHLYLWEITVIGIGSFFVALEPNKELIKGSFLSNVAKKVLPGAFMMLAGVGAIYLLGFLQNNQILYTGMFNDTIFVTMCTLLFAILGLATFFNICIPFSKYRLAVFIGIVTLNVLILAFAAFLEYSYGFTQLLSIELSALMPIHYVELIIISLGLIAIYLVITYIIDVLSSKPIKEDKKDDKNI